MKENSNSSDTSGAQQGDQQPAVFISEVEVLRRVPVSRRTWYAWRMAGKVPTVKIGRRSLYHWVSVEAALLRLQRGGL